jgi:alpha-L-rhamnosidase
MSVSLSRVSFEHHRVALGIGESSPRISWRFDGNATDWEQSAYDLEMYRSADTEPVLYSVNSTESLYVPWPAEPLKARERVQVRARAHGKSGQSSTPWSDWVAVETGLIDNNWGEAVPIAADRPFNASAPKEPIYFRKSFSFNSTIQSARLYITALGVYEAELNGEMVGDHVMAPGFQTYNNRHVYDTYDVTNLLQSGDNAIGITVAEGWFSGRLWSFEGVRSRNFYGDTVGALSLLAVTFKDGSTAEIPTDVSWHASTGPIRDSQIYDGEKYDSRLEAQFDGWSSPGFDESERDWVSVKQLPPLRGELVSPDSPPVRRMEEVKPQSVFTSPSGETLIDFGQNLVGWLRLTVSGPEGHVIHLRHAEVLEDGELALRPLRTAEAYDTLTLHGNGLQTWEPRFTFHGFRYAQVRGWPEGVSIEDGITAVVTHTDMEETGWFECSNPLLNQFHSNVRWSMKGNFLSIPTDCPQRDERAGWTGDVHAFGPTSNFLYDTAGFYRSWHRDVEFEMRARDDDMIVPPIVPMLPPGGAPENGFGGGPTAIWGDVAVGNPYNIWQTFGDPGMLEEQFAQAQNWIDKGIRRAENGLWDRSTFQFGDWLDPVAPPDSPEQATTHPHLVSDTYLIGMTALLAEMADALGQRCLGQTYRQRRQEHIQAFYDAWIDEDGEMANRTQTAYTLGIFFDIFYRGIPR